MNVSVIVCTCNRYELLDNTIDSIYKNTIKPFECIIVDQSDDKKRIGKIFNKLSKKYPIKIIFDKGKGLSRSRNIGGKAALGDILAYTDDDAYVDANWINGILESFSTQKFNTGVTGGIIRPVYGEVNRDWKIPKKWEYMLPSYDRGNYFGEYKNGELPPGVSFAVKKELFDQIGEFNEKLGVISGKKLQIFGEDSDFCLKAKKLGYHIIYNSNIIVFHPVPLSRQNQSFFNSRMFTEGATQMYLHLITNRKRYSEKIRLLLYKIISLINYSAKGKNRNEYSVYVGKKYYKYGEIIMISRLFFRKDL
jgi:GT2 family glycosyltransferase